MRQAEIHCELMVIGSGVAGMAAALFAAKRKISTVQAGLTGEINFASGLVDLLAVHKTGSKKIASDPKHAVKALIKANPEHPYARVSWEEIAGALETYFDFMGDAGLPYHHRDQKNHRIPTAAGTMKTTYGVPESMVNGAVAFEKGKKCLIVDIEGLKGFSARQMVENLKPSWPQLSHAGIKFPGTKGEAYLEQMARTLEISENRKHLAAVLNPLIKGHTHVGLPPVLGIYRIQEIQSELEQILGVKLFEIPTMPPSVTGIRIRERFERKLPELGVKTFYQKRVHTATKGINGGFQFRIGSETPEVTVLSEAVILATGRFLGKGLAADRNIIKETVFNLPVLQPGKREAWHDKLFLSHEGHAINRAGLETDRNLRPIGRDRRPVNDMLFAVGSLLAHNDWTRLKCGSGVAIATAYKAVEAFQHLRHGAGP